MEPFPGCHPETPRQADTLNCCSVHKHTQQSEPSPQRLAVAWRQPSHSRGRRSAGEATLSWGLVSIPTPTRRLTPWATPEKERVQPISRRRLMTTSHGESCGRYCRSMRAVPVFSAQSQARSQWVLDSTNVVPCHRFCCDFHGHLKCPVWGPQNCIPALWRQCWLHHICTGVVCSQV